MLHGDEDPSAYALFVGANGATPNTSTDANANARAKAFVVDDTPTLCNHDVAFVVLDRAVPESVPIAPIRLGPPRASDALVAVGWGLTGSGTLPPTRQERAGITLVGEGPLAYPEDKRYGVGAAEFLVGESSCNGDSGSPMLASGVIVGVASRSGNGKPRDPQHAAFTCEGSGVHAVYTHLGSLGALVTRAFDAAGRKPWLEGDPDPRAKAPPSGATPPSEPAPPSPGGPALAASLDVSPADPSPAAGGCSIVAIPDGDGTDAVPTAIGVTVLLAGILRIVRRLRRSRAETGRFGVSARWSTPDV
jgi:hypothetical protein